MGMAAPLGVAAPGAPPAGDVASGVISGTFSGVGPGVPFAFLGPFNVLIYASSTTALTTTNGSTNASVASGTGIAAGSAVNSKNVPRGTTWATFSGTSGTLALPTISLNGIVSTAAAQISGLASTAGLVGSTVTGPGIPASTTVLSVLVAAVPSVNNSPAQPGTVQISAIPTSAPTTTAPQAFSFALTSQAITTGVDNAAIFTGAGITYSATVQVERSFDGGATWLPCNIGNAGVLAQYSTGTPISASFGDPEGQVLYRLNCTSYASGTINWRISQSGALATSQSFASPT